MANTKYKGGRPRQANSSGAALRIPSALASIGLCTVRCLSTVPVDDGANTVILVLCQSAYMAAL